MSETQANAQKVPRRCPVCNAALVPTKVKAAAVDVCDAHGIWLDHGELEAILASRTRVISFQKQEAIRRARKEGKVSGALWGWWSLLFD